MASKARKTKALEPTAVRIAERFRANEEMPTGWHIELYANKFYPGDRVGVAFYDPNNEITDIIQTSIGDLEDAIKEFKAARNIKRVSSSTKRKKRLE